MRRNLWCAVLTSCVLLPCAATAREWTVASPSGRLTCTLSLRAEKVSASAGERLSYEVSSAGQTLIPWSPLGLVCEGSDGNVADGLTPVGVASATVSESFTLVAGKRRACTATAREIRVTFANAAGRALQVHVRAYDDGVALRYHLEGTATYAVLKEYTGVRLPPGTTAWAQPWVMDEDGRYSYEEEYTRQLLKNLDGRNKRWGHPVLLALPGGWWGFLTESGVSGSYCASHFQGSGGNGMLWYVFPPDQTGPVTGNLPLETPWRVIALGSLATVVETCIVEALAPPSRVDDLSWIRPGRVAWSWWSDFESPKNPETQKRFIDGAAQLGWEYCLIDEGWPAWRDRIPEIISYAAARNVGIILWKRAWEFTADDARTWAAWGVKGAKLDFIDTDRQEAFLKVYDPVHELTARHRLLLNWHGPTKPSGENRTWPHQLTREAVKGDENIHFKPFAPSHYINVCFTRNAIGPMDFTPVVLDAERSPTTFANQIAHAVLYWSGLQHFCDRVEHYLESPAKGFLAAVPAAWDETRFIEGAPDSHVCIARRSGTDWYLGANTLRARELAVPLSFLGGGTYRATVYRDGRRPTDIEVESREVRAADILRVPLAKSGGCAVVLRPMQ